MKTFNIKKILIPLDFSETSLLALEHGAYMASLYKANLVLLHVIKPNLLVISQEYAPMSIDVLKYHEETASRKLEELIKNIQAKDPVNITALCETGFVCSTIVSTAESVHADLIVMGTHGVSGFTERFLGSNAYRVVNDSTCPVITVQTHAVKKGFKDIVFPIDQSFYSRQKVVHAVEMARLYGSTVHILGLSHTNQEAELNKLKIKLEQVEEFMDNRGIITTRQIRTGTNYATLTMSYAETLGADLIMIMTEWEEDLTGIFIGPFARQIVNHSKIPVMSIRPDVKSELVESGMLWMEQPG